MSQVRIRLPLTALRTFEVAARLLSFKAAADELRVTPTTVSNQIRQLEREWGCLLFVRKTRQVILTDAGRSLARVIGKAFDDIREEVEAHVSSLRKVVTLAAGPILSSRWLIPRLGAFYRRHPKIELILHHSPRITDASDLSTMIVIDWGNGGWVGLEATHLINVVYRPVASPALLAERGGIPSPADLARYPIIHQYDRTEWNSWLKRAGAPSVRFTEESIINDTNVVTQAAIDGLGVTLGTFPFIQSDIDAGRLVCPFDVDLHPSRSYHLLTRPGMREGTPEVAAVCDWLVAEARATPSA